MKYLTREICINITRRCNLNCSYCYVSDFINQSNGNMKMDLSLEKIKKLVDLSLIDSIYLTGGEPFMHPEIKEIINYFFSNGKNINIATNGLLLNEEMFKFLDNKNITLLISLRDESEKTFNIINQVKLYDIKVACYHLPSDTSPQLLLDLISRCPSVKKIKLLYDSKSPQRASDWFSLLNKIYGKLKPYISDIEITVEVGFLPKKNVIAMDERRGAFPRIQISTEGLYYYCPLLVANNNGQKELPLVKCNPNICPILSKNLDEEKYSSVCCFLVTTLKNAIMIAKYGEKV